MNHRPCRRRHALAAALVASLLLQTGLAQKTATAKPAPRFSASTPCRHVGAHRPAATAPLPGSKRHVVMSFGGNAPQPDVPWFTLPAAAFAAGAVGTPNAPYAPIGGAPATAFQADNPPASGVLTHANMTRYWAPGSSSAYTIQIPSTVSLGALSTTTVASTFGSVTPVPGSPGAMYTWQQWINAVNATFNKYNTCPTSSIQINAATPALDNTRDYTTATIMMPGSVFAVGAFIWPFLPGTNLGPTGNGINEVILTDQTNASFQGGIGLASMIVDPATGMVSECDVLFAVQRLFTNTGGSTTTPDEWTALTHEVGHYYGLDHTNLHPGNQALPSNLALGPTSSTLVNFPAAPFTLTVPQYAQFVSPAGIFVPVPGMVGLITHLGPGFNYNVVPLHPDDATSLSKIYPVTAITSAMQVKMPLINNTARIIGRHWDNLVGVFGRNAWVTIDGTAGALFPVHGTITGTSRLSVRDGGMFLDPTLYVRPATHPLLYFPGGGFGAPTYYSPFTANPTFNSVVGATLAGGLEATGDFSIDGIVPGTFSDTVAPLSYEVVFEDGVPTFLSPNNQAEWFNEPGFYSQNPFQTPTAPFGPTRFRSLTAQVYGLTASSMRVVPGTVIALDPMEHDESLMTVSGGTLFDGYTRPLIDVQPRTGRFAAANVTVTAKPAVPGVTEINTASARIFINGVDQTTAIGLAGFLTNPNPAMSVWTIPMTSLPGFGVPGSVIRISFLVQEQNVPAPPFDVTPYLAFGRNDVVL